MRFRCANRISIRLRSRRDCSKASVPASDRATSRSRLDSEPNTLFTAVGTLPPGSYELRWEARAMDGEVSKGTIPFKVSAK